MMDRTVLLEQARQYFEGEELDERLLALELERWSAEAAGLLRLRPGEELPAATRGQAVRNAVAAVRANGDEGLTGSAAGSQSYAYADLHERLRAAALAERRARF